MRGQTIEVSFWSQVDIRQPMDCWLWQGMKNHDGYGRMRHGNARTLTHRISYALVRGPIPEGMRVLHHCDVRDCVNPNHLFLGTQADNIRDMDAKGRRRPARGEGHGRAKLNRAQALEIRASSDSDTILAAQYSVAKSLIWAIRHDRIWL